LNLAEKVALKNVWIVSAIVVLYGLGNGLLLIATPQAGLSLQLGSDHIGMIAAGLPIGYAISCLLCGRLFRAVPGKYVLMGGLLGGALSMLGMSQARTAWGCVASQLGFGLASGAFWPFASAWLLDFETPSISRARLLRHYNVGWTSGTAAGMLIAGWICRKGYIFETILAGGAVIASIFFLAMVPPANPPLRNARGADGVPHSALHITKMLLLAAVLANLSALGTRTLILNTYAELNKAYDFGAERMGYFAAAPLIAQLVTFSAGSFYERWLGMRRVYVLMAVALVAINLIFAWERSFPVLLGAVILHGVVLALAFQSGMLAATSFFSSPRAGTTFHETVIGMAGTAPLAAGMLVNDLKGRGYETIEALQAPFLFMSGAAVIYLVAQMILISGASERALLSGKAGVAK